MNIFGTSFDYRARLAKVRKLMEERGIDCLLVLQWPNQYYLSGFYQHLPWYPDCHSFATEAPLIIFREPEKPPVFLCAVLTYNAVREGTWIEDVRAYDRASKQNVQEAIAAVLKENGVDTGAIGLEEECCTIKTFEKLKQVLPQAEFKHASELLYLARVIKEPEEVELIRKAVLICESAINAAREVAKPGVLESEIQKAVEMEIKRGGGIREVETMCQTGIRTANYRAFGSALKKVEENDLVMIDLGCVYKGYGCDITRMWVVGKPTDEQKKIADDLYKQHEKVLAFIKPGVKCHEVADFAIHELNRMGYPTDKREFPFQQFSLHGVGLGPFHELPEVSHRDMVLEEGMVIAVQPSVRHEKYTIRFEDDGLIASGGLELMTTLPREWI